MAEGKIDSAQKAQNTCTDHENEEVEMYCRICREAICTKCVKGDHREHDWDTMFKIAKKLRQKTSQEKPKVESLSKSIMIGITEMLDFLASEAETELTLSCSKLGSRRKIIVEHVKKSFDEMKLKCEVKHKSKLEFIQEHKTLLESKGKRIGILIENMETGAKDFTNQDLIELHSEIYRLLYELQDLTVPPYEMHDRIVYRKGSANIEIPESLLGTVEEDKTSPKVMLDKELKIGDTGINSMHLLSEKEAWVHPMHSTVNHLVDSCGNIKKSVDFGCKIYNFTLCKDENIYFCDYRRRTVKKIDDHGNITSLFSTSPLFPLYIELTKSGDILITLMDEIFFIESAPVVVW